MQNYVPRHAIERSPNVRRKVNLRSQVIPEKGDVRVVGEAGVKSGGEEASEHEARRSERGCLASLGIIFQNCSLGLLLL